MFQSMICDCHLSSRVFRVGLQKQCLQKGRSKGIPKGKALAGWRFFILIWFGRGRWHFSRDCNVRCIWALTKTLISWHSCWEALRSIDCSSYVCSIDCSTYTPLERAVERNVLKPKKETPREPPELQHEQPSWNTLLKQPWKGFSLQGSLGPEKEQMWRILILRPASLQGL